LELMKATLSRGVPQCPLRIDHGTRTLPN
jgi:hypothetical protein